MAFEEEEIVWILEQLKKVVELPESYGFIRKFKGRSRTHLVETCFNSRGRYIRISEFITNRKYSLIVPNDVKGRGWEALWKSIFSMSESPFHSVRRTKEVEAKVKNKAGLVRWFGDRSYARVVEEKGPGKGALLPVGKWATTVIYGG